MDVIVYYPKNPDNSPCPPAFELVVQHVKKDEYPYKDPLIRGDTEQDIRTKAKVLSPIPSCIVQRHLYFNQSMLPFQESLNVDLQHEQYLASVFSIKMLFHLHVHAGTKVLVSAYTSLIEVQVSGHNEIVW